VGWVGSVGLTECMKDTPCGCDLLEEAKLVRDPRVRASKESDGKYFQEVWQCPRRKNCPPARPLGPKAQETLAGVATLTMAEGLETCPLYYARLDWVCDVVRLRRWYLKGQLGLRMPHPSAVIVDAIDAIEDSVSMREAHDIDRAMKDRPPPASPPSLSLGPPKP
jgi:hypothetical protein